MSHIGSRKNAAFIRDWIFTEYWGGHAADDPDYFEELIGEGEVVVPDGWRFLASGSFRMAFIGPDGVVYKVDIRSEGWEPEYLGLQEVKNARKLRKRADAKGYIGEHIRIPLVSGYNFHGEVVVAMEYVKGPLGWNTNANNAIRSAITTLGLCDMHGFNWIFENSTKRAVPIDLASEYYYNAG